MIVEASGRSVHVTQKLWCARGAVGECCDHDHQPEHGKSGGTGRSTDAE